MLRRSLLLILLLFGITISTAQADQIQNTITAKAFFVDLKDGNTVKNPLLVKFGVRGMKIAPAETYDPGTGHFHLLIDTSLSDEEEQFAIPKDEKHLHFGKGQTETKLTLTPGPYTLQIVMGDGNHELHKPPVMSPIIKIIVE